MDLAQTGAMTLMSPQAFGVQDPCLLNFLTSNLHLSTFILISSFQILYL